MKILAQGVHKFQNEVFGTHKELFDTLSEIQRPHTLFITCSDSRINPNMLTQAGPGEIFIIRNAGNIIPRYEEQCGGEAATIEFAVSGLGIEHVVVCGHSSCGAMKALLNPEITNSLPALRKWLLHSKEVRSLVEGKYGDRTEDEHWNIAIQENVLLQIENLRTHPAVAKALEAGKLHVYGWVYKIGTGEVFSYDPSDEQFHPLGEVGSKERIARGKIGNDDILI